MSDLVSVVIPTHDRPELLLRRCLPSVLRQTHTNLDIHVVGDATDAISEGGVRQIMESDRRVRFTNLPKQKLPDDRGQQWCVLGLEARNHGHDTALGQYIANLDDDDEWQPFMVAELLREVQKGYDIAYGRSIAYGADGSTAWYGNWPPMHFAFCDGAWLSRHDLGIRYDPECIMRGLTADGDRIDRMVAAGLRFSMLDTIVHTYYPNPR